MSKFVSFWAQFGSGASFHGNTILPDFDIQTEEDIRVQEDVIKSACNHGINGPDERIVFVTLTNWKVL